MTGNKAYLAEYQDYNGGPVAFGGSKGYITGKGKIKIGKLDFEDVCFVKELQHFNLFSVSQMCDKKNKVLFTDTECLVLSPDFKLLDENDMRLGHVNFKNLNKLVKGNLVRGLPSKIFQNDHTCVACQKGKQHKASCKAKSVSSISQPLQLLHMDLFGPTSFDGKSDEGFLVGYSLNSKAFRVYYLETKRVEENLHITFLENKPNIAGKGPNWLFDLDYLTDSMNYQPVRSENQAYKNAGLKEANHSAVKSSEAKNEGENPNKTNEKPIDQEDQVVLEELERIKSQEKETNDAAEALRKEFAQDTKDLLLQAGAALRVDNPKYPKKVYKVVKALYGLHQAPRAWYATLSTFLLKSGYRRGTIDKTLFIKKDKNDIMLVQVYVDDIIFGSTKRSWCDEFEALMKSRFQMSSMGELTFFLGLQVKQKEDGIFISQDKYVAEILKKFDFASVKTASTPIETQKPLVKDEEASDVDVHLYRSMIGSLMYLTASRPDIMFAVCACSRFQVTPKTSHLNVVKRIFRYLKGKPKLGLWYPRVSSFDLEAYSDSDYAGANLDRKSTTGGCQFLGRRLISWQCKKQTIVATSTTEAEYVAAANCCGQVLWIQNQMLDYGFNFMNTKIYIDNESTICIVKNPVFHSKTKHIAIRHHFIRDAYEKKLIQVLKIHTDDNVADLLTKAFDVNSYLGFRESLERDIDGTEELLLPDLFILWLTKVSTDSAKLIPLGKDSTAIKTLEKIPPRV
ncbi:putative ribonuclease H-like domain-containing protein [Tanacetum coccineum]